MLTENVRLLERQFSSLWNELQDNQARYSDSASSLFQTETARNGSPTIKVVREGTAAYLHSKYNPQDEAKQFISVFEDIDGYDHVFFYGVGLGYHIEAFRERYPNKPFTIYEPYPELLYKFLEQRRWSGIASRHLQHIYVEWNEADRQRHLQQYVTQLKDKVLLVTSAAYERLFPERTKAFTQRFSDLVRDQLNSFGTNNKFVLHWTQNAMKNFPKILQTQNFVGEKRRFFAGKPVVLASAGPSLQDEFDNLKHIKENGLAYICAVGSANRSLVKAGIMPDLVTTYDPFTGQLNHEVFGEITSQGISTIPMVYGSTVGHLTPETYPGPLLHMFISQDTVAPYYLGANQINERHSMLSDAPSIAVVTLQLLSILGCSAVILVGQNFAYRGNQFYAAGIEYATRSTEITEADKIGAIQVPSVDGGIVETNEGFNRMRIQMEGYIASMRNLRILNATQGGAQIAGTTYVTLERLLRDELRERIVEANWYEGEPTAYDLAFVRKQAEAMQEAKEQWEKSYDNLIEHFRKIDEGVNYRNAKALAKQFPLFDQAFNEWTGNPFHQVFVQPIVRNMLQLILRSTKQIQETGDPIAKGRLLLDIMGNYVYTCNGAKRWLEGEFETLQSAVFEWCSEAIQA